MEWISVKDRLPESINRLVLWYRPDEHSIYKIWIDSSHVINPLATHWMPLPSPPKQK
jgi:hypothetical protein